MKRIITSLAVMLALGGCAVDTASGDRAARDRTGDQASAGESPSDWFEDADAPEPPPTPEPDGTYTSSCDYLLGNFTEYTQNGYRFVADANVKNTGNIGIVMTMKATWFQAGGGQETKKKELRLKPGQRKRVGITLPVSQDQIDRIQSLDTGKICNVKVTITDTFGEPE